jgi:pilus assembly protein FimV
MSLRTLAFVSGVATALSAQIAVALGLGEIKLNSTLNQPLDAEIQLLQVRDLSEQEILVGLASSEDFRRVGVDRPFFLADLKFTVDLDSQGKPVVRVTSQKPVREPYLNFLVQAQWPSGRLLREYTLLMDLPVYAEDQQAQPVQPAQQGRQQQTARPATQQNQAQNRTSSNQPAQTQEQRASGGGGTYGPVKASDNLWNIAVATLPDDSVSVQQAMIAIQKANPGAFINDNINLLRKGQVLRIPGRDEMVVLSARDAIAQVSYQNQNLAGKAESNAARPQLEGSRSYTTDDQRVEGPEGRVKLTSPSDIANSSEGRGTGAGDGSTEALENELASTLEELDRVSGENIELKSRLETLEAQIETMERLMAVSNEELRALQLSAAQAKQDANDQDVTAAQNAPAEQVATTEPVADAPTPAEPVQPQADEAPQEAETAAPVRDPSRVVRSAPKPEKSWLDLLFENIVFVGLGLVALLAALGLVLRSRKNKNPEEDVFEDYALETDNEDFRVDDELVESEDADQDAAVVAAAAGDMDENPAAEETRAEPETEDPIAEAEIYAALGKYDQAEELLLRALEREPLNKDLRLKLMELHADQQDLESFDSQYAKLLVLDDFDANARAEELRSKFDDASSFDPTRHDTTDFANLVAGTAAVGIAAGAAARDNNDDFAFDLDFDESGAEEEGGEKAERLDEEINESLNSADGLNEFDLDLDFENELTGAAEEADSAETVKTDSVEGDLTVGDEDDLAFDFELDIDEASATEDQESDAGEFDLSDEFAFDLGLDEDESTEKKPAVEETDEAGEESAEDEFDFNVALDEAEAEKKEDALELADTFEGLDFNIENEALGQVEPTTDAEEADFDEFDALKEELETAEEPVTLEDTVEVAGSAPVTSEVSEEDELNIDGDMDLSALDEELDAITAGLDEEFSGSLAQEDNALALEEESSLEDEGSLDEESPDLAASFELDEDVGEELEALEVGEDNAEPSAAESLEDDILTLDSVLESEEVDVSEPAAKAEDEEEAPDFADLSGASNEGEEDHELADMEAPSADAEELSADLESSVEVEEPSADIEPLADTEELSVDFDDLDTLLESDEAGAAESEAVESTQDGLEAEAGELNSTADEQVAAQQADSKGEESDEDLGDFDAFMESSDDFDLGDFDLEGEDDDSDLGFLSDSDETATKLDLARAYIDMGDADGAKDILDEIMQEGSDEQKGEAQKLLERV